MVNPRKKSKASSSSDSKSKTQKSRRSPRVATAHELASPKITATAVLLEILQGGAEVTADLFDTFLCSYQESYRRARGKLHGTRPHVSFEEDWADLYLEKQRFYSRLSKLKATGLICKKKTKAGSFWTLTKAGEERVTPVIFVEEAVFPTLLSYDIPEVLRPERDWLRATLGEIGFELIHQSLWIGHKQFTEAFLAELQERKVLEHVQIMEVSKTGSVEIRAKK